MNYLYFWGHTSKDFKIGKEVLSQWYESKMIIDQLSFFTCEQYMMYKKAITFGDIIAANKILHTKDPKLAKRIGRTVKNFDHNIWDSVKEDIVYRANLAKFTQNPKLKNFLLNTNDLHLVEASPFDRIWGIGYNAKDALNNKENWGENLLGIALMKVRAAIKIQVYTNEKN